jgi:hypothetical protein
MTLLLYMSSLTLKLCQDQKLACQHDNKATPHYLYLQKMIFKVYASLNHE